MTSTSLARKYAVDVSTDGTTWLRLDAITDRNKQVTPNKIDSTTYDSNGWTSTEVTLQSWSIVVKLYRQPTSGVYTPATELCRATQGQFGDNIRLYVRTYDKFTGAEAQSGRAIVEWNEDKTGVADLNAITVTFTGDGALTNLGTITLPTIPLPVLTAATPSAQTVGNQITITGQYLTGATALTIGGVTVPTGKFTVISDLTISAIIPTGTAGSAPIIVTTPGGTSAALAYTRGA